MLRDGKIVIMGKRKNDITKVTAASLLYLQNTVLEPFSLLNCKPNEQTLIGHKKSTTVLVPIHRVWKSINKVSLYNYESEVYFQRIYFSCQDQNLQVKLWPFGAKIQIFQTLWPNVCFCHFSPTCHWWSRQLGALVCSYHQ